MDMIKQAATSICFVAVAIGAILIISPNGAAGKNLKFIFGLLTILCIITPFFGASFESFKINTDKTVSFNAQQMLEGQAAFIIESTLKNEGFLFEKIEIITDISEDGNISINNVYIYGAHDSEKIRDFINSTFTVREVSFYA